MKQRLAAIIVGVILGAPSLALAQDSNGLESVATRVKPGTQVSVITTDGERLRARFDRATGSELTVRSRDKTVVLPASKVGSVMKHDSSWDGAGWGALAGVLIGSLTVVTYDESEGEYDKFSAVALSMGGLGFLGLGVGFAVDASNHPVIYKGGPQVTIRPDVSSFTPPGATKAGTRAGVRATIAW